MEGNEYTRESLARLPREELRRLLTEELRKDTQQIDDVLVRNLLAELQVRGADPSFVDDDAVTAACEKFRIDTESERAPKKRWYQYWLLKVAAVVLVLGVLFFSLPAAEARSVPEVLSWWSDNLFQFFRPGSKANIEEYVFKTNHPGLQEIHDAVTEAGITVPIVPSQLSDEFILEELKVSQLEEDTSLFARLESDRKEILFTAITHSEQAMLQHEKKAESIAVWDIADIDHYVIYNTDTFIITWVTDNIECTITTDCPEEDVYRLICSIYTSED